MIGSETIQLLANLAVIAGIFFLAWQVMITFKSFRMDLDQKKTDRALQYIARWNDVEFNKLRRQVLVKFRQLNIENQASELSQIYSDVELRGNTNLLLNFLEEVSIGVNHGHVNFDIVFLYFGPLSIMYFELLHPWILHLRERKVDQTIWIEIEHFYGLVTKHMSENYTVPPGRYWSA